MKILMYFFVLLISGKSFSALSVDSSYCYVCLMYVACTGLQVELNNKHSKTFYFSEKIWPETVVVYMNISR